MQWMRIMGAALLAMALLGAALVLPAAAQQERDLLESPGDGYVEEHDNGALDWGDGEILGTGIGTPSDSAVSMAQSRAMAQRAATVVARRNLLEIIKGVQIDSATTIENYMVTDDAVQARVQGYLQNSQIVDTQYLPDGSVQVTVGLNLRGDFADTVIPRTTLFDTAPRTMHAEPYAPPPLDPVPLDSGNGGYASAGGEYTGLVVDARGLGVRPAMTPRILDENGEEVYGSTVVSREYAIEQGMAGYARDPQQAASNDRVAGHPLRITAQAVSGEAGTDIVISNEDAAVLRRAAAGSAFLEECRVMIVLD